MALTTQQKLDAANDALHKLVTGQMARVFMDQNGERIEYTATNIAQLKSYIASLQAELLGVSPTVRRPLGFIF